LCSTGTTLMSRLAIPVAGDDLLAPFLN